MAGGRPSKWKADYVRQAVKACEMGATIQDLADLFGVNLSTVNLWMKEKPEFSDAVNEARDAADRAVERSLFQRARGFVCIETKIATHNGMITDSLDVEKHYPPDATSMIFWLKNRQPARWRDVQERKVTLETGDEKELTDEQLLDIARGGGKRSPAKKGGTKKPTGLH